MSLDTFVDRFAGDASSVIGLADDMSAQEPGALDKFIDKFNGVTEPYYFYDNTVELRFQTDEHIYYLVGALGELTPQDGVTNICHIIDKSPALVPWSAKMVVQKLLRTMPTLTKQECPVTDPTATDYVKAGSPTVPVEYIPEMTLEAFTKIALEAKSAPRDVLEEAGDVGHMAHTWLEYFIKALLSGDVQSQESKLLNMPKDERAKNCVLAALGWMKTHNVRWISTERKIYSKKYSYAGTMDGLCMVDSCDDPTCCALPFKDRLTVADWKSSNYLYIEYLYQTAAYEYAYEEEFGVDIKDRWILRLGKEDGEFDPWHTTEEDFQEDFEGFLDALSLTRSVRLTNERMKGQKKAIREMKKAMKAAAKEQEKAAKKEAKALEVAERRAKKALEKEALKLKKKAERQALKDAGIKTPEDITCDKIFGPGEVLEVLGTEDSKVFAEALLNPPAPNEALAKAALRLMENGAEMLTITGRTQSEPEMQEPLRGNMHTVPDQPKEIVNGTPVTMDFAEIELRVLASLLPEETVTPAQAYGSLPEESL